MPAATGEPQWVVRMDAWVDSWKPGFVTGAALFGPIVGPAVGLLEYFFANRAGTGTAVAPSAAALVVAIGCLVGITWVRGRASSWRSRGVMLARHGTVLLIGGALWVLPGGWSIPRQVFTFPGDWLALSVPFPLAALLVKPGLAARWRVLAATPLLVTALMWPTLCTHAAATIRDRAGVPADEWFAVRIAGYTPDGYSLNGAGTPELAYHSTRADLEYGDDLVLRSWPATAASPCDALREYAWDKTAWSCDAVPGGFWTAEDEDQDIFLATRYGSRYVVAELPGDAGWPIPPDRLPGILATLHLADDHELLAMFNKY
ncbi:MAG: hypothetical protein HOW97_14870 [Catenulispora sp.]|nr:hypothetical protein [Catenulispora sp.]